MPVHNGVTAGCLVMDRPLYQSIVQELLLPISAIPNFRLIARRFGVSPDTIYSIYSQDVTTRVKRRHHLLRQGGAELARRYMGGADALQLCYEVDLPPCTVMRVLLEHLPLGVPSSKVTELLRHPALLPALANPACSAWQQYCAPCGAVPGSLPAVLARLQADIELCVECDACCSPASDLSRHTAGREYEERLYKCLDDSGVAYWTEDSLRSRGFFKTPDAKLQVPIAVHGRVVNWIDSKATFGDDKTHREQALAQYQKYVNRFGPGLVIYWHGFIADLAQLPGGEDVLLLDDFPHPQHLLTLPRLPLRLAAGGQGSSNDGASAVGEAGSSEQHLPEEGQGAAAAAAAGRMVTVSLSHAVAAGG